MGEVDTQALREAAVNLRTVAGSSGGTATPLAEIKTLMVDTEISFPSFGLYLMYVNSKYQQFRTYLDASFTAAADNLNATAEQLELAAAHWDAVEAANKNGMTP